MLRFTARLALLLPLLAGCPKDNKDAVPTPATPAAAAGPTRGRGFLPDIKEGDTVATVKGQPVLGKEILDKIRAQEAKAEAEYLGKVAEIRERALKGLVMDRLLTEEAKKAGKATLEEYVRAEAEKNKQPATEARLRSLYARLVPNGNPPFEEVKMELGQAAAQEDGQQAVAALVDRVLKDNEVKWLLPSPQFPKVDVSVDDDPILGDKDAKVTIIEFSDFECPYCGQAATAVHEVVDRFKGKVRVVYRDFPLSFHPAAKGAAMAGGCANEQGKFWPFHDLLFKNQKTLDEKALKTFARMAGLDGAKFDECVASQKYKDEVEKDVKDGETVGVEGTPTFFINGRPFSGAPTLDGISDAVDAALKEG